MKYDILLKYNLYSSLSKDIVRTGWIRSGIKDGESIAEHLFHTLMNVIILRKLLGDLSIDWNKAFILASLHDLAEVELGDIPTYEKSSSDREIERVKLSNMFNELSLEDEWVDELFHYRSREALIVKVADLLATIFQGLNYIDKGICNEYLKNIVINSLNKLGTIPLDSREFSLIYNFIKGYVQARVVKSCARNQNYK